MIKRVVLAVVSLAAGALVLAAPASFGAAAQAATSTGAATAVDWGPNHDGWHVHVNNATRYVALYIPEALDNVYRAPKQIPPFTKTTDIRGRASIFGGPADMNVVYKLSGSQDSAGGTVHMTVFIRSDAFGKVSAWCLVQGKFVWPPEGYYCALAPVASNMPITVTFYTIGAVTGNSGKPADLVP